MNAHRSFVSASRVPLLAPAAALYPLFVSMGSACAVATIKLDPFPTPANARLEATCWAVSCGEGPNYCAINAGGGVRVGRGCGRRSAFSDLSHMP